uniref:Uncharacterized protein n=1 Tax=Rhizophora mucronata TaxID=61149 RepID=A0A2P2KKC5_RHIMU
MYRVSYNPKACSVVARNKNYKKSTAVQFELEMPPKYTHPSPILVPLDTPKGGLSFTT